MRRLAAAAAAVAALTAMATATAADAAADTPTVVTTPYSPQSLWRAGGADDQAGAVVTDADGGRAAWLDETANDQRLILADSSAAATDRVLWASPAGSWALSPTIDAAGDTVAYIDATDRSAPTLDVVAVDTGAVTVLPVPAGEAVQAAAISGDGATVAALWRDSTGETLATIATGGGDPTTLESWPTKTMPRLAADNLAPGYPGQQMTVSADGTTIAYTAYGVGGHSAIYAAAGNTNDEACRPHVVTVAADGTVTDTDEGTDGAGNPLPTGCYGAVAYPGQFRPLLSAAGTTLAFNVFNGQSDNSYAAVKNLTTGAVEQLTTDPQLGGSIALALSADGTTLVWADDNDAQPYAPTAFRTATLDLFVRDIVDCAGTCVDQTLGTARVYNTGDGNGLETTVLSSSGLDATNEAAISGDGSRVIAVGTDSEIGQVSVPDADASSIDSTAQVYARTLATPTLTLTGVTANSPSCVGIASTLVSYTADDLSGVSWVALLPPGTDANTLDNSAGSGTALTVTPDGHGTGSLCVYPGDYAGNSTLVLTDTSGRRVLVPVTIPAPGDGGHHKPPFVEPPVAGAHVRGTGVASAAVSWRNPAGAHGTTVTVTGCLRHPLSRWVSAPAHTLALSGVRAGHSCSVALVSVRGRYRSAARQATAADTTTTLTSRSRVFCRPGHKVHLRVRIHQWGGHRVPVVLWVRVDGGHAALWQARTGTNGVASLSHGLWARTRIRIQARYAGTTGRLGSASADQTIRVERRR